MPGIDPTMRPNIAPRNAAPILIGVNETENPVTIIQSSPLFPSPLL